MEQSPPELERVLPDEDQIDELEDGELVEEDAGDHGDDKQTQLGHDGGQLGHAQDLGADHAADTQGGDPNTFVTKKLSPLAFSFAVGFNKY